MFNTEKSEQGSHRPEPVVSEKLPRSSRAPSPWPSSPTDHGVVACFQILPVKEAKARIIVLRLPCTAELRGC